MRYFCVLSDSVVKPQYQEPVGQSMTFETYGYNLRITDNAARRIQDNRISCHRSIVSQMLDNGKLYPRADSTVQMGRPCRECHREVPHGITCNLTTTQANPGLKKL